MKTRDLCTRNVVKASGALDLAQAAAIMRENHVGSLVVVDEREPLKPTGMITDRDLVVKVIAGGVDAKTVTIDEVVGGRKLVVARESDDALESLRTMRRAGVRRLPVVDKRGQLVGIVSLDDYLEAEAGYLADMVEALSRERGRELQHAR